MLDHSPESLAALLDGGGAEVDALVRSLVPPIQAEVARLLVRGGRARGRDGRQEVLDATQEILCALFANDARVLRAWNPEKGRKLVSFVRLVAKRKVITMLRSQSRTPWADDPTEHGTLEAMARGDGDAHDQERRDALHRLWEGLKPHLGERGLVLFRLLFVEQEDVEVAMERTGMSRDAIYAWRSRLRKQARKLGEEMGLR